MKILIADDDPHNRELLLKCLSLYGERHVAVNGQEAVDRHREALEAGGPYDLICMDVELPGLDGQQALKEIRALEKEKKLGWSACAKVIMITAASDPENMKKAFLDGRCDAYLIKPVDQYTLLEQIRKLGLR